MRCDTHIHIVGPPDRYPQVANRTYLAAPASLAALEAAGATADVRRFVIVQPSFYGFDNTLLLEGLDALQGRGRGVAVVDPERFAAAEGHDFHARGVRGLRINLYSPLAIKAPLAARFGALEAIALRHGWHVQVIAPLKMLAAEAALLGRSRVPVVIDHYGLYAGHTPDSEAGRAYLALLRNPHVWVKLSGAYRSSDDALAMTPDPAWLAAILEAAEARCVWGSDWPHTPPHDAQGDGQAMLTYRPLRYADLVARFIAAIGAPARAERILTENAARLYDY